MKNKLYIAGLVNLMVILTGSLFKILHLPLAGILISIGIVCFAVFFLPAALISAYSGSQKNGLLYAVTWVTCFVVFTAMLFKIMHWPFAGILLTLAIPLPYIVFLPVFLYSTSRENQLTLNKTSVVMFLLVLSSVFNVLLSVS
ncbi:MAG TPA: hypothetical protein VK213_14595 [Bacteroidales bacterium]|nr:hypothetical protein [Bacteroidales bacterium]